MPCVRQAWAAESNCTPTRAAMSPLMHVGVGFLTQSEAARNIIRQCIMCRHKPASKQPHPSTLYLFPVDLPNASTQLHNDWAYILPAYKAGQTAPLAKCTGPGWSGRPAGGCLAPGQGAGCQVCEWCSKPPRNRAKLGDNDFYITALAVG